MRSDSFGDLVQLYRKSGMPEIDAGSFSGEVQCSVENNNIIKSCRELSGERSFGYFSDEEADGDTLSGSDDIPVDCGIYSYTWKLASAGNCQFYKDVSDLVNNHPKTIGRGVLPNNFFLIDNDYCNSDQKAAPEVLEKLLVISRTIGLLSELAQYNDQKTQSSYYRLVFIHTEKDERICTTVLETEVESSFLALPKPDISILEELARDHESSDLHFTEKQSIFRTTISEFINSSPRHTKTFHHLLSHWPEFLNRFRVNLDAYLSRFSFSNIRREVAEAEFSVAEQYSKVMGDITGKLLSLPISLAAVIGIYKSADVLSSSVYMLGTLLVALVMAGSVSNQQRQLKCIENSKSLIFDSLQGRLNSYPDKLKLALNEVTISLRDNGVFLARTLYLFRIIAWVPVVFTTVIFIGKYGNESILLQFLYLYIHFVLIICLFRGVLKVSIKDKY